MKLKENIVQKLELLNELELEKVDNFISLLKIESTLGNSARKDWGEIANLYQEFAQEDRLLAEKGINEYRDLLSQEDLL